MKKNKQKKSTTKINNRSYISRLYVGNLKAFKGQNEVEFAPMINLVFGKNSSGKSTINQALRLFRQSYGVNKLTPFNYESPPEFKNNGGLDVDVGYKGLVNNGQEKSNITLGVETGLYSKNEGKILDNKKSIKYSYKFIKKFYTGKNLVSENTILSEIHYTNEGGEAKITLPKYKFFDDNSPLGRALREGERYHSGEYFYPRVKYDPKSDIIYKSVYNPYYYETIFKPEDLKIKSIEESFNEIKNEDNDLIKEFFIEYLKHLKKRLNNFKEKRKLRKVLDWLTYRKSLDPLAKEIFKIKKKSNGNLKKQIISFSKIYETVFQVYDDEFLEYDERMDRVKSDLRVHIQDIKKLISFFSKKKIDKKDFLNFFKKDICQKCTNIIFFNGYFMRLPTIQKNRSAWREQRDRNYLINILNFLISNSKFGRRNVDLFNSYARRFKSSNSSLGSVTEVMNKFLVVPGLRQIPKRYFVKGLQTSYVGPSAENLGELLANPEINKATNKWFEKLEIPYKVDIQKSGNYYEIIFVPNNSKIKISSMHVGLGYPLILPFIVQCIIAKDRVILIEEPEVHLHPKIEADLADLITESSIERNNQFIIETHSEDFLLRILKSVRKEKLKPENISINYIIPDRKKGSEIHKINVNKFGQYTTPWKDNLFAERRREFSD